MPSKNVMVATDSDAIAEGDRKATVTTFVLGPVLEPALRSMTLQKTNSLTLPHGKVNGKMAGGIL